MKTRLHTVFRKSETHRGHHVTFRYYCASKWKLDVGEEDIIIQSIDIENNSSF